MVPLTPFAGSLCVLSPFVNDSILGLTKLLTCFITSEQDLSCVQSHFWVTAWNELLTICNKDVLQVPFVPDKTLIFFENENSKFCSFRYRTTFIFRIKCDTCLIYTTFYNNVYHTVVLKSINIKKECLWIKTLCWSTTTKRYVQRGRSCWKHRATNRQHIACSMTQSYESSFGCWTMSRNACISFTLSGKYRNLSAAPGQKELLQKFFIVHSSDLREQPHILWKDHP